MMKTVKLKLDPNKTQKILLAKHIGSTVFVWNKFLNERKEEYKTNKKSLNYYDNARSLTELKKQEDLKWLKEINSQTLQATLKDLDTAYNRFYKRLADFPVYKSKFRKATFRVPQSVSIAGRYLKIPKFDYIRIQTKDYKLDGTIKFATISREADGYYVAITFEVKEPPAVEHTGKAVGVDLGIKSLAQCSDGTTIANGRYTKSYAKKLSIFQKHLARKMKGSNRRKKAKLKVAKIHK